MGYGFLKSWLLASQCVGIVRLGATYVYEFEMARKAAREYLSYVRTCSRQLGVWIKVPPSDVRENRLVLYSALPYEM